MVIIVACFLPSWKKFLLTAVKHQSKVWTQGLVLVMSWNMRAFMMIMILKYHF